MPISSTRARALFLYPLRNRKTRQFPTLPPSCPGSTIGTRGLNFRVRNGNGCDPSVMIAGIVSNPNQCFFVLINFMVKSHGLLVLVS
jgi:hypothetical protein